MQPLHNNTEVCPTVLQMRHDALQSLIAVHDGEDIETLPAGDVPASNDAGEAIIMDTAHILLPERNDGLIYRIPYHVGDGAKGQQNWTCNVVQALHQVNPVGPPLPYFGHHH